MMHYIALGDKKMATLFAQLLFWNVMTCKGGQLYIYKVDRRTNAWCDIYSTLVTLLGRSLTDYPLYIVVFDDMGKLRLYADKKI